MSKSHDARDGVYPGRRPIWLATIQLQLALVIVFLIDIAAGGTSPRGPVDTAIGFSADGILAGEIWRLLTAPLLHNNSGTFEQFGAQHLLTNILVLSIVGPLWQQMVGYARWWLTVLLLAPLGFLGVLSLPIASANEYFGGASSITWGLLALVLAAPLFKGCHYWFRTFRWRLSAACAGVMISWNVAQALNEGIAISNWVHLFAFLGGVALSLLFVPRFVSRSGQGNPSRRRAKV